MRRLFLYLFVAILVFGALRAMHGHRAARPVPPPPAHWRNRPGPHEDAARRQRELAEAKRQAREALAEARRAMEEARRDVHQAWHEVRDELNRAYREARDEIRQAYREAVAEHQGHRPVMPPPPLPAPAPAREVVDGLPVPIVPGTRVTEAEARPPVPARTTSQAVHPAPVVPVAQAVSVATIATATNEVHRVPGQLCATKDRAQADARKALQAEVAKWLEPDVPASWTPPAQLLESMVMGTQIDPYISETDKDDGPLYTAVLTADFSPARRAELVDIYNHDLVQHRLMTLGGALGFVLICLAAISGYIRADEATKGYYTNRLRLLAAAGVGAAGVIVYRMIA